MVLDKLLCEHKLRIHRLGHPISAFISLNIDALLILGLNKYNNDINDNNKDNDSGKLLSNTQQVPVSVC